MCRRRNDLVLARSLAALILLALAMTLAPAAVARTVCSLTLGFKALHDLLPDVVGECVEDAQVDPATGNLTQRTTNGLLMWRKADNWTAFTDGPNTYIARPEGVVSRPTDGLRLPFEGSEPPPSARSGGPRSPRAPGSETVLFQDTFDDLAASTCRSIAGVAHSTVTLACVDGELQMSGVSAPQTSFQIWPPGRYGNASLAVDARLVTGFEQRTLILHCREDPEQDVSYALLVTPALQAFVMGRRDSDGWESLVGPATSPAIKPGGESNRLELNCAGDRVTGRANGVDLGSFQDATYRSGRFRVSAYNPSNVPLPIDVRLDNLVVSER